MLANTFSVALQPLCSVRMKCLSVLFGLVLVSLPGSLLAAPLELFVSPEGRDDWSGRQASPNSSKSDGPFATLPAALNAARIARGNNTAPDGITIWLRGGLYELPEPIKLIYIEKTCSIPRFRLAGPGVTGRVPAARTSSSSITFMTSGSSG